MDGTGVCNRHFENTKLANGVYTRGASGFQVMATEAPSAHHSGVTIFYRKMEHFYIKISASTA